MTSILHARHLGRWLLLGALIVTTAVYWPGLSGGWLFDDYPNIVDNHGVQPTDASMPSLVRAALSSPSSEFKRPLASLSFAANYLATGLDPYWMKLTNLLIHLLNGLLVFLLARVLLLTTPVGAHPVRDGFLGCAREKPSRTGCAPTGALGMIGGRPVRTARALSSDRRSRLGVVAALIAASWMLLPINLTGVLYVVQRMESMANAFVLLGLIGYVAGRRRMLATPAAASDSAASDSATSASATAHKVEPWPGRASRRSQRGFALCVISIIVPTALGVLAKETAVMLPLYAVLIEWALFGFRKPGQQVVDESLPSARASTAPGGHPARRWMAFVGRALPAALRRSHPQQKPAANGSPTHANSFAAEADPTTAPTNTGSPLRAAGHATRDWRVIAMFLLVLVLPLLLGLVWLLPRLLRPEAWATRDFTLDTRLLSEARIVADYVRWTLLPTPDALSFYHDDFRVSTGLLTPWTTLAGMTFLAALVALTLWLRARMPLVALGIALFLGCQLLTGTILPLELIYEHRNYFASFGLLLAIVPLLAAPRRKPEPAHKGLPPVVGEPVGATSGATDESGTEAAHKSIAAEAAPTTAHTSPEWAGSLPFALPRYVLLAGLLLFWTALTAVTAYMWGSPLRLAEDLASRAPLSPRAQYELGRTYIIYSHYDRASPFTPLVYAPLERAAALPESSILPQQALIFMNARLHLPPKDAWWTSLIAKLGARPPGVQDESSLSALTQCARQGNCDLPTDRMIAAFTAALSHPNPNARLLATYGDYAWNVLADHPLGLRMTQRAVHAAPDEPAYQITLVRMLVAQGRSADAENTLKQLEALNIGGRLDTRLSELRALPGLR